MIEFNLIEKTKRRLHGIIRLQSIIRGNFVRVKLLKMHAEQVRNEALRSFQEELRRDQLLMFRPAKRSQNDEARFVAEKQFQLLETKNPNNRRLRW